MAIMGVVDKELSRNNSVSFSNNDTCDLRLVEHQFTRLKNWIADLKGDRHHCELEVLLCPLFCHLYLEMLCGNHAQSASEFFDRHKALFSSRESCPKVVEELSNVSNSQDIKFNAYIKSFRSSKYQLHLSSDAVIMLQKYLSEHGHLLILQILLKWFELDMLNFKLGIEEESNLERRMQNAIKDEESQINRPKQDKNEVTLNHVRDVSLLQKECFPPGIILKDEKNDDTLNKVKIVQSWLDGDLKDSLHIVKEEPECEQCVTDVAKDCVSQDTNVKEENIDEAINEVKDEETHAQKPTNRKDVLKKICDVVRDVNEKPNSETLLLYRISNVHQNSRIACTKVNEPVSLLSAGVNNSVKLWGLARKLRCRTQFSHIDLRTATPHISSKLEKPRPAPVCLSKEENVVTLYGHSAPVQDVAFVPCSVSPGVLVSVSQDATMRSWRLDNYRNVAAYRGHNHEIWCVDVSSLGLYVGTGSRDRTARIWSLERNFPLRTCAGHQLDVECIKFHPNNLYFATGSADKTVKMWSVNDAKLLRLFFGHTNAIQALAFSPDGKFLASAAENKIKVWDLAAGKLLKDYDGHTGPVLSLSWDKTNELLSSCSTDGTVRVWSLQNNGDSSENPSSNYLQIYTLGHGVISVQYSRYNSLICTAVS